MKYFYLVTLTTLFLSCGSSEKHISTTTTTTAATGKCLEGNCEDGLGKYQYNNDDKYHGYFRSERRNGFGVYYFKDGDISYGGYLNGLRHGEYVYIFKDGAKIVGDYFKGEKDGLFDIYSSDGELNNFDYYRQGRKLKSSEYPENIFKPSVTQFKGDYIKVSFSDSWWSAGEIIMEFTPTNTSPSRITLYPPGHRNAFYLVDSNNKRYELDYQSGFEGDGIDGFGSRRLDEEFSVGLSFEDFYSGKVESASLIEGECETCWHFKNIALPDVDGCVTGDCRSGYGIQEDSSSGIWGGSFTEKYEGFFENGEWHGQGMLTRNGVIYIGSFIEGYFEGDGTIIYENGNKYIGDIYDEIREGYGKFYQSEYLAFIGTWKDDEPYNGTGYNSDGSVQHKGKWKDWKPAR